MEKKERGILGRFLVFILTLLAIVGLVAMALSVMCSHVNPKHFVWISFFGLAFWEILVYNVVVFFLLLLLWSRRVWIVVMALLIAIPGFNKSYSFGSKVENEKGFRIMSYNIALFYPIDGTTKREDFAQQIIDMVRENSVDVFCCQEFSTFKVRMSRVQCIQYFSEKLDMPYVYYNRKKNYSGNVIFSKYPITKVTEQSGFGDEQTYGIMVEVDAGESGKFHVANVHLLSNMLTTGELKVITNASENQSKLDTVGKSVLKKLVYAFRHRSDEINDMIQGMPPVEGPVIVCGDFNDTPLSYTYRRMQKAGFVDTFIKVGQGIKPTYAGRLPLLRIDYIWANSDVKPLRFERYRKKASDHYPVVLDFSLKQ